jgi:predicted dehydrogenase
VQHKTRFAIIGAGAVAEFHTKAISENPRAELVAVSSRGIEHAHALASRYGAPLVFDDEQRMLKRDDIDVVSVCTPSGLHCEAAVAAAEAGKHVLCEKPLEITRKKMDRMIAACRNAGVKLGAVFQRRTSPASAAIRQAVLQGKLGRMVLGDAYLKFNRSPEYYLSAGWRGTRAIDGGGALMNQGVHGVDLIQWLMGDIQSVYAYSAALVRDIEVEDTAVAVVKYKSGTFGVIEGTTSVYPGREARFELHGEKGSIIYADSGFKEWKIEGSDETAPNVQATASSSNDPLNYSVAGHAILVDDMIGAIRENRDPMITGEDARKSVDVILAIYESAREGKEVALQPAEGYSERRKQ